MLFVVSYAPRNLAIPGGQPLAQQAGNVHGTCMVLALHWMGTCTLFGLFLVALLPLACERLRVETLSRYSCADDLAALLVCYFGARSRATPP